MCLNHWVSKAGSWLMAVCCLCLMSSLTIEETYLAEKHVPASFDVWINHKNIGISRRGLEKIPCLYSGVIRFACPVRVKP